MTFTPAPKPGPSKQKARSRARKKAWRNFQEWAYANLKPECQRCGVTLPDGVQPGNISHIKHRQMGGTWRKWINELPNLRVLCGSCHDSHPGWSG